MSHFAPIRPRKERSTTGRVVRWFAGAAVLAVLLVGALAVAATSPVPPAPSATVPAAPVTWTTAQPAVDEQAADGSLAGDGTYVVGSDVEPGTYKTLGASDGPSGMCYWARLSDTDGELDSIIANDVGKGRQTVTIRKTDKAFTTRGCATWTKS